LLICVIFSNDTNTQIFFKIPKSYYLLLVFELGISLFFPGW
jgi:hypothetical protein